MGEKLKIYFEDYFHIDYESNGRRRDHAFITVSEEFRDEKVIWGQNIYTLGLPPTGMTSEKIINIISAGVVNYLNMVFERGDNIDSITTTMLTPEEQLNRLASLAVMKAGDQVLLDMSADGIIHKPTKKLFFTNGDTSTYYYEWEPLNKEEDERRDKFWKKYEYGWTGIGEKKQGEVIEDYANFLIVAAISTIKKLNYRLVDKSCTTTGEDCFEVRYLLDPHLEIVFPVRKVGKSFVSDGFTIQGNIFQDSKS